MYCLQVTFHLQTQEPPILPPLCALFRQSPDVLRGRPLHAGHQAKAGVLEASHSSKATDDCQIAVQPELITIAPVLPPSKKLVLSMSGVMLVYHTSLCMLTPRSSSSHWMYQRRVPSTAVNQESPTLIRSTEATLLMIATASNFGNTNRQQCHPLNIQHSRSLSIWESHRAVLTAIGQQCTELGGTVLCCLSYK